MLALESDDTGAVGGRRSLTGSSAAHCSCNAAHVFFLFPRIGTTRGVSRSTVCVQGLARAAGEGQREFSELVVLTFPQKSDLLSLTCIYRSSLNSPAARTQARVALFLFCGFEVLSRGVVRGREVTCRPNVLEHACKVNRKCVVERRGG